MSDKILFNIKDCDYTMQITQSYKGLLKLQPSQLGTELDENDVINLIAVLSNWLNEQRKK